MKYNLCSSCVNFQRLLKSMTVNLPRSCKCPLLKQIFGAENGGFYSGIDIIHCDEFVQWPATYGDVFLTADGVHGTSYVLTHKRNELGLPYLYDNIQNIKIVKIENERKRQITEFDF